MSFLSRIGRSAFVAGATLLLTPIVPSAMASGEIAKTFARASPDSLATVDHSAWDRLLKQYVVPAENGLNRVAYARLKADGHSQLKAYVTRLEAVDVAKLGRQEQFAFWANLYNAKTVDIILDKYPVASIKDINLGGGVLASIKGGPWTAKITKVAGHALSLDDIEHVILRGLFKDPRVHYAVNCASVGCPNLQAEAFVGAQLNAQLDNAAKQFINSPRGIRVSSDGRIAVSSIYSWFQSDFGGNDQGVIAHAKEYAAPELNKGLGASGGRLEFEYDWRLNDAN